MQILSRAPTRISLCGGGTDLPEFADKYGGFCLNMAINIRQEFIITSERSGGVGVRNPFVDKVLRSVGMSKREYVQTFDGIVTGGIGSSAAATVALVGAANRMYSAPRSSLMKKEEIAETAWKIEVEELGLYGGRQDQYCAAFGGVNGMEFGKDKVTVVPLQRSFIDDLGSSIILFHLGFNRKNPQIQQV